MASTRRKALVALLLLGLLLGAGAGYYVITSINQQGGLFNQALGFIFPNYFHHIPYAYASPLTLQLDMNWLEQIFKNIPKDFKIPEELQNVPVDYIPPIHQFSAGLIDPEATVMIVIPHDPNYPHQYWKVSTFDYYGEGDWYKTQLNTYPISITAPSSLPPNAQFFTIIMNITHDVSSSTALPVLYPDPYFTTEISSSQGDLNDAEIERDEYNNSRVNLFFTDKGVSEISYDVAGVPPDTDWVSSNAMPATYTPPAIRDVYTQLPSSLANDPTFKSFADSFSGIGNNAYEVAQAVQAELLSGKYINNITRLTEGAPLTDEDPVVRFLKEKEGTCIDFASTFVTTLRYLGVSARLVIGYDDRYAQADYSGGTLKYIIKAFNIYAWAEVWVPTSPSGEGIWVPFDPTPPPTITFPSGTEWIDQQFNVPPELIGSLGPIALFSYGLSTETTVFTAKPEEPGFAVRYWRVKAYNYYSDGEWNCTNQTMYELQTWTKSELESTIPETFEYYNVLMNVSHDVNLTIVIPIPFPGPYILNGSSYTISSVQGDMTSASLSQDIFNNTYLNALFTDSGTSTLNYTIAVYNLDLSAIKSSAQPPAGNIPEEISELYLQIPSTLESDPTFTAFVNTIESGDNAYETALNALNRLTSGEYIYNASMMVSGVNIQEDPIVWFLKNKVGTPILFASTYVMALRHFGIPARLVIGYLTQNTTSDGEVVHEAKNIYIYAWAEVWIPTGGGNGYWVSFDPTPDPLPATFATIN
nr:transglutaminase-like domain-containing protein [Candidatus Freyrarchaeum guaymaensis]